VSADCIAASLNSDRGALDKPDCVGVCCWSVRRSIIVSTDYSRAIVVVVAGAISEHAASAAVRILQRVVARSP